MARHSESGKIRLLSTLAPALSGYVLVKALERTCSGKGKKAAKKAAKRMVDVTDKYGLTSRLTPAECITLVCNSLEECYLGSGTKHRIRSITYRAPAAPAKPELKILDSGFSGFNRYPLPDQSTNRSKCLTHGIDSLKLAA
jgi:hypothetical protein